MKTELESLLDELQSIVELWLSENPMQTSTEGDWGRVTGHQECAEKLQAIINGHASNDSDNLHGNTSGQTGLVQPVVSLKNRVSEVIRGAASGMDSWGQVSDRYRTLDGHVRWDLAEKAIHAAIDEANAKDRVHEDRMEPVVSLDGIHCGECPNLKPYGDEHDLTAKCALTGNDLMWHDYWIAECDVRKYSACGGCSPESTSDYAACDGCPHR